MQQKQIVPIFPSEIHLSACGMRAQKLHFMADPDVDPAVDSTFFSVAGLLARS
jgi:hypothetical protein